MSSELLLEDEVQGDARLALLRVFQARKFNPKGGYYPGKERARPVPPEVWQALQDKGLIYRTLSEATAYQLTERGLRVADALDEQVGWI